MIKCIKVLMGMFVCQTTAAQLCWRVTRQALISDQHLYVKGFMPAFAYISYFAWQEV